MIWQIIRRIIRDWVWPDGLNESEERELYWEAYRRNMYNLYGDPRILELPAPKVDPPYGPGNFGNPIRPYGPYIPNDGAVGSIIPLFDSAQSTAPQPPRRYDPLILDLDGDGIETVASTDGAYFDHDGNGFAERTGWVSADDGLLVRDINGDGIINDGGELFGDQTILQNGQTAADSFQALADLDGNADGKIDANDAAFSQLRIWQDVDGNGYSTADELKTLAELGISALNTGHTDTDIPDGLGNTQVQAGTFDKTDSATGQMGGFLLQRDTTYTIADEWLDVTADIAALPDLQGYGNIYDLQQAMVRDELRRAA